MSNGLTMREPDQATQILVIDDNPEDRELLERLAHAAAAPAHVYTATNGWEGAAWLEAHGADCVLLDFQLDGEDGLAVLGDLGQIEPFCPVIIMTGHGSERTAVSSMMSGAADYLVKGEITEGTLREAIGKARAKAAERRKAAEQDDTQKRFLKTLTHDLRAPLRQIGGFASLALRDYDTAEGGRVKDLLEQQMAATRAAVELLDTLSAYALLEETVGLTPVDLDVVVAQASDNLSAYITERAGEVHTGQLPPVVGNQVQLVQLFQNLIQNGIKYNKSDRPTVTIETVTRSDRQATIVVSDNGIGIPTDSLDAIFAPLKRLWGPVDYEGSGLGLAICKKIAAGHGGRIWCTSIKSKGSRFFVMLPAAKERPQDASVATDTVAG